MLLYDFKAKARWTYRGTGLRSVLRAIFSDASLSMILYRAMSYLNDWIVTKPIAVIICKINALFCGAVFGRGAKFGKGFVVLHSVGIVVNSKVHGGDDIIFESGVVIGEEKRHCPQLGNNIFIGSGAKLFGNITIGNNVIIGANAVVNKDVPDNVTVAGVPAKIVKRLNEECEPTSDVSHHTDIQACSR